MPLSYFRRPMALIVIAYICVLAIMGSLGVFRLDVTEAGADWVHEPCIRLEGRIVSGLTENRIGPRVRIRANEITGECGREDSEGVAAVHVGFAGTPPEVLTYLSKNDDAVKDLWPGERAVFEGRMRLPRWPRNPGEFDEKEFLSDQGISFVFYARRIGILDRKIPVLWLPMYWAEKMHRSIHRVLLESYPPGVAGILEGMLLGYKGLLDAQAHRAIQDAGVMHLLVPSGAKVAFVTTFLFWIAMGIGLRPAPRFFIVAIFAGFYVLVVGAEPPYIRSYLGALILGAAHFWKRETQGFQALVLSAFAVLVLHPRDLFSVGFQMSYLVVLGIVIAMPRWKLEARYPRILGWTIQALWISLVAQLMLVPILARTFGRISCIGVLANVLLIPASAIVFATGFALWMLSFLSIPWMFDALSRMLGRMADIFQWICLHFALIPGAAFDVAPFYWWETIAYYLLVFGILVMPRWRTSLGAWGMAVGIILAVWTRAWIQGPSLRIVFLSQRGRGSAIAQFPRGENILIDGGVAPSVTARALRALGIRKLDEILPLKNRPELRFGRFHMRFGVMPGISIGDVGDPRSEFCIIQSSAKVVLENLPARRFDAGRDGAVWVNSNGKRDDVTSQKQLHAFGDLVP